MRVALIDPSLFTWPYDRELALALTSTGHEARIFGKVLGSSDSSLEDPILEQHFYPSMASDVWKRMPKPAFQAAKGLSHIGSMARLLPALRAWAPDVIHFHWLPLPIVDRHFLALFGRIAPIVLTVHDTLPFNGAPGSSLQTLGALKALRSFDHLIVHTGQGLERVSLHVGSGERIAQVPHGLLHQDAASPPPVRAKTGPDGTVTFLLFGKLKPYKGVDVLIQALSMLCPAARAKCRVRVVGKPYMDTEPLTRMAEDLNVTKMIDFQFRFISDQELTAQMDESAMLVFPYREIEASGVLMAGIARSRPVIASKLGSFAELLEDGKHGLLVPPDDPSTLATAMERVIIEVGLVDRLGAGMENLRSSIPAWTDIAQQTTAVYEAARRHQQARMASKNGLSSADAEGLPADSSPSP
jgi:glycosyltransferase involved in cell wall biosynthesis